jgi:hypothetical protein
LKRVNEELYQFNKQGKGGRTETWEKEEKGRQNRKREEKIKIYEKEDRGGKEKKDLKNRETRKQTTKLQREEKLD